VSDLLERYVTFHNEGVRRRDFSSLLALFAPDAVMRFDGVATGPFSGASAIAEAFRDDPPSDELELLDQLPASNWAVYGWAKRPGMPAGELRIAEQDGLIVELLVSARTRRS